MVRRAFNILGIEVTTDVREIKKAYAALVKQYHPEEHPAEWAKIHEAYQAALEYADMSGFRAGEASDGMPGDWEQENVFRQEGTEPQGSGQNGSGPEEECKEETLQGAEVVEDAVYGEMFQEEQSRWIQEKTEHERRLQKRLRKLAAYRRKKAVRGWKHFFEAEFLQDEGADSLILLLEAVREYGLSEEILQLIEPVMAARAEIYDSRGEADCSRIAEEVVKYCRAKLEGRPKKQRKPLSRLWIFPILAVAFLGIALSGQHGGSEKERDAAIKAAAYLEEKYKEDHYTIGNLTAEKETLLGSSGDEMESYRIKQESGAVVACAVRDLTGENGAYIFFDNIQAEEIKQAFEERINERTGHAEGYLFWDSRTGDPLSGGIENGFFQTRYEGDIDVFIQSEAKVRGNIPKTTEAYLSDEVLSLNGACDYYLPDPEVKTLSEKFEKQDFPEDTELQEALGQCAADYQIQIRGVMLPENLFTERMGEAVWNETEIPVMRDLQGMDGMKPSASFLLLTGWYVNLPPEDEKKLNIHNGMYTREIIPMGEGIYGAESSILSDQFGLDPEWAAGCIEKIDTPEYVGLTEKERKKAVSFHMAEGYVLPNDCCLAIDKKTYGIANAGYKVIITELYGDEMRNHEGYVWEYGEASAALKYGEILDGEGYVILEYSKAGSANIAQVVTIVNP